MVKELYIGIDPGSSSGAMTVIYIYNDNAVSMEHHEFKKVTLKDLSDIVERIVMLDVGMFCVLEKVGGRPGQGGKAMFTFGENYGAIQALLLAHKIPFEMVSPQKWMKSYGMKRDKDEPKTLWKNRLKALAQQYYPNEKIVANTSDSTLIARFCQNEYKPQKK